MEGERVNSITKWHNYKIQMRDQTLRLRFYLLVARKAWSQPLELCYI